MSEETRGVLTLVAIAFAWLAFVLLFYLQKRRGKPGLAFLQGWEMLATGLVMFTLLAIANVEHPLFLVCFAGFALLEVGGIISWIRRRRSVGTTAQADSSTTPTP
jgi:hypothetical protein